MFNFIKMNHSNKISIFKPSILASKPYRGGVSRGDIKQKPTVERLYKMSSNENMLGPSPKALAAIQRNLATLNEYNFHDDDPFREALAEAFNHQIGADQFITANSGMEILDLITRGFLDTDLEVIISTPTFGAYKSFTHINDAKIIDIQLVGRNFELDVEGILSAVTEKTRLIFVTNPNNPTGSFIPKYAMDTLIYSLPPHVLVVYDEVYHHYVESKNYARAADYIAEGRNIIGVHSFSKSYGLAGIRLGYAFSTPEIAAYLNLMRRPFMINTLTMEAGIAALKDTAHIAATQALNKAGKQWIYDEFDALNIQYWRSEANFILFKSPCENAVFTDKMLENGVMIRPCELFDLPNFARVTVGTMAANRAFIAALKATVKELELAMEMA
jgi:histidinol-phosphate aminotransferase